MTSTRSGKASLIRSASTFASAVVHSANRTRMWGPGRLRSVAAVNVAWATSSGVNPSCGGAPQRLRHDAGQGLPAAPHRRPVHDARPRPVPPDDVARVREAAVDGPHRVRVDAQRGAQLTDRRQARARLQPAGLDLVGELPEDLGGDRDVGVALDVELVTAPRGPGPRRAVRRVRTGPFRLLDIVE